MQELWQLYNDNQLPIPGKGATKDEVYGQGLLHGAAHVWIWRRSDAGEIEILLQKRSANKRTWPNLYDISAAGHIDLGETNLQAAVREAEEEIGLTVDPAQLKQIDVHRMQMQTGGGDTENEFQWVYLLELTADTELKLQESEVSQVIWKPLAEFIDETANHSELYVPHGKQYFDVIIAALKSTA